MADEDYYARKHEMLLEYNTKRKKLWIAMLLCAGFGALGVHRIYLGSYKMAALIFGLFLVALYVSNQSYASWVYSHPYAGGLTGSILVALAVYYVIIIVELFLSTNFTDGVNKKLRAKLEQKYDVA